MDSNMPFLCPTKYRYVALTEEQSDIKNHARYVRKREVSWPSRNYFSLMEDNTSHGFKQKMNHLNKGKMHYNETNGFVKWWLG